MYDYDKAKMQLLKEHDQLMEVNVILKHFITSCTVIIIIINLLKRSGRV